MFFGSIWLADTHMQDLRAEARTRAERREALAGRPSRARHVPPVSGRRAR